MSKLKIGPSLWRAVCHRCTRAQIRILYVNSHLQILRENGRLEVVGTAHTSPGVRSLVKAVVGGLRAWQQPEASTEGLGGTYFFLDELGRRTAIVKPCDEEPLAPNNPKVTIFPLLPSFFPQAINTIDPAKHYPFSSITPVFKQYPRLEASVSCLGIGSPIPGGAVQEGTQRMQAVKETRSRIERVRAEDSLVWKEMKGS